MKFIEIEDQIDRRLKEFINELGLANANSVIKFLLLINSGFIAFLLDEDNPLKELKENQERMGIIYNSLCTSVLNQILEQEKTGKK